MARGAITQPEAITLERARVVAAQWVENEARTLIEYGLSRYYGNDPVARQCAIWAMALGSLTRGDLSKAKGVHTIVAAWPVFASEMLREKARSENNTAVPTEVFEHAFEALRATFENCGVHPIFGGSVGCTEPFVLMSGGPAVFALAAAKFADGQAREALLNVARMGCTNALKDFEQQIAIRCFGSVRYFVFGGSRPRPNSANPWCRIFLWLENYCKAGELPDISSPPSFELQPQAESMPTDTQPLPAGQGKLKGLLFLAGGGVALYLGLRAMKVI